ncbi:MAG: 50S ribosomal protein L17, partial [Actinomyces urogenitalis DORA_12]
PVAKQEVVADAVATAKRAAEAAVAKEDKTEAPAAEAKKEYAGAVRLEEGSAEAPDDEHKVKGNEDSMKYHVPGSRWYDATVAEVWFASAEDAEAAGFAPAGGAAAQKVEEA